MDLESRWHVYTYRDEEPESVSEFSARINDLYTDCRSPSEDYEGVSEGVIRRVIDVETEMREL